MLMQKNTNAPAILHSTVAKDSFKAFRIDFYLSRCYGKKGEMHYPLLDISEGMQSCIKGIKTFIRNSTLIQN